ncbi:unnamed protein product [Hymenolepis diminuta]|uniref:Secreted RxLR effector peptide protein n=1 Tax=Hymenolepis diminuta TaxID=6216 RepID=A0A0R3SVG1_HYMDI|nr:unnamed protein product [Hymenolepis diminuta]
MGMSFNLQGKFCATLLVSVFFVCSALAVPRTTINDAELAKILKLRELIKSLDEDDLVRIPSDHFSSYTKRWSPIRQFRGGLLEV